MPMDLWINKPTHWKHPNASFLPYWIKSSFDLALLVLEWTWLDKPGPKKGMLSLVRTRI